MNPIRILDQVTIDRIAAGEVVERPASVIKELTENAIDAGSTRITIEIRGGGIEMIRVTDNGCGIAPGEIPLAFQRHATSKIVGAGDLQSLRTLGFRGEALSSIAAVSKVELVTKREEDLAASRYVIEGGREKLCEEIGAPDGTTIIVRDLFYNTPARAKFLKSAMTEAAHVGEIVEQLILSNPETAFSYLVNGQLKLSSSGSGKLADAVYRIYGRDLTRLLLPVSASNEYLAIEGLIGKPQISRGNRNFENYYVNGRYVKSRMIAKAVEDAYGTKLMQHQYPFACFFLTTDTSAVDVNVHPTKMEVRFSDEKQIYDFIRGAVKDALDGVDMTADGALTSLKKEEDRSKEKKEPRPAEPFETKELQRSFITGANDASQPAAFKRPDAAEPLPSHISDITEPIPSRETPKGRYEQQSFTPVFLSEEAKPYRRIIGQVLDTYWIAQYEDSVYVFDQHAAHERVLFEKFMKEFENRDVSSQLLSPPLVITLDAKEEAMLLQHIEAFSALGFEIEHFGERDYAVRAVPYSLGLIPSDVLFHEILDQLDTTQTLSDNKLYIRKVATTACKAAVKGGGRLSAAEASQLLDDLMKCEDPYHCPHGRPTILSFDRQEIEKRFKRIV